MPGTGSAGACSGGAGAMPGTGSAGGMYVTGSAGGPASSSQTLKILKILKISLNLNPPAFKMIF